jgi:hypothetical protein
VPPLPEQPRSDAPHEARRDLDEARRDLDEARRDLDSDPDLAPGSDVGNDARLLSAKLALCVIEILAGARPLDQLGRWVSDAVFIQLLRRTVIAARSREITGEEARRPRVRVGEPRLSRPGDSVVEAVVMIHQPTRSRAVALRLERHRVRWRATAISVL